MPEGYAIRDCDSTNGTLIKGIRISKAFLAYGTEFQLGSTLLVFCRLNATPERGAVRAAAHGKSHDGSLAVQKFTSHGIGYSLAEWSDVRHVFAAAVPQRGTTLRAQADDALRTIETVTGVHGTRGAIVHQAVFVADPSMIDECRRIIHEFYGKHLPATSYIPQAPCAGKLLAIEAIGLGCGRATVKIERHNEQLVIARHNGITWAHAAPTLARTDTGSAYDQGQAALRALQSLLAGAHLRMDQVIRTWLYQGGIVADEGASQRYKELNRARTDYFAGIHFLRNLLPPGHAMPAYPASTGIGAEGRNLDISAIALATDRTDVVAVPLENPRQTAAYSYAANYSPKSPKFARAVALACGDYAMIFVSGTASIVNSETLHVGDVVAQTQETIENIAALIGEENLARHGLPGMGANLAGLGFARVYIKRKHDYDLVRAVCEQRLGELPMVFAIADICRPELLVEIEGVALSRKVLSP